jgi:hypothetical protein
MNVGEWFKKRCKHFKTCGCYQPSVLCDDNRIGKKHCKFYKTQEQE